MANRTAQRRVIDIGVLSEDELLSKLRGYINSMCTFAQSTRNVHKELKETLANSNRVMMQYIKVRQQGQNNDASDKVLKSAHTQKKHGGKPEKVTTCDAETQSPCCWGCERPSERKMGMASTAEEICAAAGTPSSSWTEIVKRGKRQKLPTAAAEDGKMVEKPKAPQRRVKTRPLAILVDVATADYPEIAKKIRGGVDQKVIGDSVVGMRQTRSGGLLIEVRGDQARLEEIRAEVARSAGSEVGVRALQQRALVEVVDMDQWSSSGEVLNAVANATSTDQVCIKVVSVRKRFGGSQTALVSLPTAAARALTDSGRLRVGMVSCRVR